MRGRIPGRGAVELCLSFALILGGARTGQAATISVAAGGDLQAAINTAQPGDVIALAAGATFTGNFVLPNKGSSTQPITIRSAALDSSLPPLGVRMTPAYAALLPKLKSGNTAAALRTASAAHHWTLMFLEFQANYRGYNSIIDLGAGDSTQTLLTQVPHHLILDRIYVHGDPIMGQKRCVGLNSSDTTVINSYVSDCKAIGQDAGALGGWNGPGNYLIENNYLEASTENVIFGGADPTIPNLVTTNVVFRGNYVSKPIAWRNAIVATPLGVGAVAAPGGGSLAAGTYYYKVVARVVSYTGLKATSSASVEVSAKLAAGTSGGIRISWSPVAGAADYVVYGRTAGDRKPVLDNHFSVFHRRGSRRDERNAGRRDEMAGQEPVRAEERAGCPRRRQRVREPLGRRPVRLRHSAHSTKPERRCPVGRRPTRDVSRQHHPACRGWREYSRHRRHSSVTARQPPRVQPQRDGRSHVHELGIGLTSVPNRRADPIPSRLTTARS